MSLKPRVFGLFAVLVLLAPHVASATDWLKIRRGGVPAIVAAAQSAQGGAAWMAVYAPKVPKKHPLAKARLTVSWRPLPAKKNVPQRFESAVVWTGIKGGKTGLAAVGDEVWARWGGRKPVRAEGKHLMDPVPGVGVPLALFQMLGLSPLFDLKLEGEFGGTAVLRCNPRYAGLQGLSNTKLGISKQSRFAEMAEIGAGDGKSDLKLAWIDISEVRGQLVADGARVMRPDGTLVLGLERVGLKLGKSAKKLKFGKDALR